MELETESAVVHKKEEGDGEEKDAILCDEGNVAVNNTAEDPVRKHRYLLKCFGAYLAWALLFVSNVFHIYVVATLLGPRMDCYTCTQMETIIPWFVWYTSWCLWLTTASFIASQWFTTTTSSVGHILFRLALPWSITTAISYSYYIATTNGGSEFVDEDLCWTVSDSAIPKTTTPRAAATTYLVFDRIANFTAHYACMIINLSLFVGRNKTGLKYECDRLSWCGLAMYSAMGIIIALVHSHVDKVYCTDDIWSTIFQSTGVFAVVHIILVLIQRRCFPKDTEGGRQPQA